MWVEMYEDGIDESRDHSVCEGLGGSGGSHARGGGSRTRGSGLLIAAPLRIEALLIDSATRTAQVCRTGMGRERSLTAARELRAHPAAAILAMGFCGGLQESSEPGDVIVSSHLLRDECDASGRQATPIACSGADVLAAALAERELRVRCGTVVSVAAFARGKTRTELRDRSQAIAVDMESAWLASHLHERPFCAVRIVVDTPTRELTHPLATLAGGMRAAIVLRRVARAVDDLVGTHGVHTVFGIDS